MPYIVLKLTEAEETFTLPTTLCAATIALEAVHNYTDTQLLVLTAENLVDYSVVGKHLIPAIAVLPVEPTNTCRYQTLHRSFAEIRLGLRTFDNIPTKLSEPIIVVLSLQ